MEYKYSYYDDSDTESDEESYDGSECPIWMNANKDKLMAGGFRSYIDEGKDAWQKFLTQERMRKVKEMEESFKARQEGMSSPQCYESDSEDELETVRDYRYKVTNHVARFEELEFQRSQGELVVESYITKEVPGQDEINQLYEQVADRYNYIGDTNTYINARYWFDNIDVIAWHKSGLKRIMRILIDNKILTKREIIMQTCDMRSSREIVKGVFHYVSRMFLGVEDTGMYNQWKYWWEDSEEKLIYGLMYGWHAAVWLYGMPDHQMHLINHMFFRGFIKHSLRWVDGSLSVQVQHKDEGKAIWHSLEARHERFGVCINDIWYKILTLVDPSQFVKLRRICRSFTDVIDSRIDEVMKRVVKRDRSQLVDLCSHRIAKWILGKDELICGCNAADLARAVRNWLIPKELGSYMEDMQGLNMYERYWVSQYMLMFGEEDRQRIFRMVQHIRVFCGNITYKGLNFIVSVVRKLSPQDEEEAKLFMEDMLVGYVFKDNELHLGTAYDTQQLKNILNNSRLVHADVYGDVCRTFSNWMK